MKKVCSVLMAILLSLSVSGCGSEGNVVLDDPHSTTAVSNTLTKPVTSASKSTPAKAPASSAIQGGTNKKDSPTTTRQGKSTQAPPSAPEEAPDYSGIDCRRVADGQWQTVQIKNPATNIYLQLDIPADWALASKDSRTLRVLRAGKTIGTVTTASLPEPQDYFDVWGGGSAEYCIDGIRQINWHKENGKDRFYRFFQFNCTSEGGAFSVKLRVDYTELDDDAADRLLDTAITVPQAEPFVPLSQSNGSKNILILGNSFIGTSQIGTFLNDMLAAAGSEYTATAISVGMAEVQTFTADNELCKAIRDGRYGYVFQCGLYSKQAVTALGTMRQNCRTSNTPLVIFPAHNEGDSLIATARDTYEDLCLLDWKGEINALIDDGVGYDDFCVDDYHKHSTPLAGYVGAHMIYQTLFDEAPPAITSASPLTMNAVRSKLGGYVDKGSDYFAFTGMVYEMQ